MSNASDMEHAQYGDDVRAVLIEKGLVPNEFILDLNKSLTVPHGMDLPAPWNLPSRMFRFPIEVSGRHDGPRRIGLMHPLLVDHPFVQRVQTLLGIEIDPDGAPNKYDYRSGKHAQWWHAVDLVSAGRWQDLLETDRFTTPDLIAHAVVHGLEFPQHDDKKRKGYIGTV